MISVPDGWAATTLSEIAFWGSGGTPSRSNPNYYGGGIPWIKTGELGQRFVLSTEETITEEGLSKSSAKIFPAGAVAIAMYGATIGKTSILGIDAATNQACAVGIPKAELTSKEYLFHYLCSQKEAFVEAGKGGAQPNISQSVIKDWDVPLAPLPEQKRIADKLDAVLARVDACRDRLDRMPAIIKRFRQSVLAAATSGKLTEDWRDDMAISMEETWATKQLKDISTDVSYGYTASSVEAPIGPKMLRITDIQNNQVDWSSVPYCEIEKSKKPQYVLKHGDLVFARTGATVGKSYLIWGEIPEAVFASYLIRVRCNESNSIEYLSLFFQSNAYWSQIMEFSAGVAQPSVNGTKLKELLIPLPRVQEQHEIVRRVEALFAYADRIEARYTTARTQVEKLTPATLAKAFRGELVPQDPNDEPASVLLERMHAARESAPEKIRGRRKGAIS